MRRIVVLALLAILTTNAQAQQICSERIEFRTPTNRYFDYGDGRVLDLVTGLVWQRCPLGYEFSNNGTAQDLSDDSCTQAELASTQPWQAALQAVHNGNLAGGWYTHTDWRIPNAHELASIAEYRCSRPAVNVDIFPDTPANLFWSSTQDLDTDSIVMMVDFSNGAVSSRSKTSEFPVRLVRGPIPVR